MAVAQTCPGTGSQRAPLEAPAQGTAPPQLPHSRSGWLGPGSAAQLSTVWHAWHNAAWHCILHNVTWHSMAQLRMHGRVQHSMAWHSSAQ